MFIFQNRNKIRQSQRYELQIQLIRCQFKMMKFNLYETRKIEIQQEEGTDKLDRIELLKNCIKSEI